MLYNRALVSLLLVAAACKGEKVRVASGRLDTLAFLQFRTFAIKPPRQRADSIGLNADMDPMQPTSVVGRAIRQDLTDAFTHRGYHIAGNSPDFYIMYDTGIDENVIVSVMDARTDSVVWSGSGVAKMSDDPKKYAANIHGTVNEIVAGFPMAHR